MVKPFIYPAVPREPVACFAITAGSCLHSVFDRLPDAFSHVGQIGPLIAEDAPRLAMPAVPLEAKL